MTTFSDLIPNPTEVELRFKKLIVNGDTATYYYYDAKTPMKNDQGEPILLSATEDPTTGAMIPQYLYEYIPIPVSIYNADGITERPISDLEAEAAYAAIKMFQQKYTEQAMEEYVIPDEIIMDGNLYII